jgi:hypothetical protein
MVLLMFRLVLLISFCFFVSTSFTVRTCQCFTTRKIHLLRKQQKQRKQCRAFTFKRPATAYDDWQSSGLVDTTYPSEENVQDCLDEFIQSDSGHTMFGCHDAPFSIGITGELSFVELEGPHVILSLRGSFWHRRETILQRAAVWLNARMPEVTHVTVEDVEELLDFEEIVDDFSGNVLGRVDKRAPDFNGDRATMEYQGLDPDDRGPFPPSVLFGSSSRLTINPV